MFIIDILKYIKRRSMLKLLRQYALISSTVIDRGIYMRLDIPEDRKYLVIGDKSIVAGNFYFESRSGKIQIGKECFVGNSTFISHSAITIGDHVTIGWGGTIYDHDSHSLDYMDRRKDINDEYIDIKHKDNFIKHKDWSVVQTAPIIIEDDVWIGMNCIILKGVTIGKGAIVGAGSVITHNVPAWTVVGGNPAKVVKMIEHENN